MTALPGRLPDAEWRHRPGLDRLLDRLGAPAGEARFVGGAVRDSLLGLPVKDVDIATVHRPEAVLARLGDAGIKVVPTGLAHGTVTAVLSGRPVEITTLRRDVATDGRRAEVAFSDDWQADAARRDFTINALYADPADGTLHDYFGGRDDLAAGRVRFIGDPGQRIMEDHLRILRFFRFLARFGADAPDAASHAACVERAATLRALSRERVADELLRLLGLPDPRAALALMIAGGIMAQIVPEIEAEARPRLDALGEAEGATATPPDALRRLMALLGPPAERADRVAARLKLSNRMRRRIATALIPVTAATPHELAYRVGVEGAVDRMLLGLAFTPGEVAALAGWTPPRLPLSGGDLIALGVPAGPEVARALRALENAWIAAGYPDAAATRALAVQIASNSGLSSQRS